ncbi:MAG: lipopolysaccharide biosynthesis protein [Oscillospiraceae bacterium]|nr:lipopolysaccharide biosynthesis protein [Oscillospiraceae bacterium]
MDTPKKVIFNLIWRYAERCGAQLIQFVVSIVLARLLTPSDYGLVGLITVFIAIANVFAQSGLGQALVQRKNADDTDFSTVFYYSIGFSIILYVILFFSAPFIAGFYNEPLLTAVIRVLGLVVVIGAVNSVQQAYVQKTMQFKRFFWATLGGTLVSAVVGIAMAYKGLGVWALVAQQLTNQCIDTIVLWLTVKWRPIWAFSITRMKQLFSYGWKLLCSSLLDTAYNNIYSLVIGKFYSSSDLGYYNRGKQFPMLIIQNINSAIDSVLFPVLSEAQNEKERLKAMTRRAIVTSTFLIFPAMAGLAAVAKPLTVILLTEKWLPAVPFIQFCCFTYAFWPVHTANLQAIKAIGRSDIFLKLEIIKKVIGITTLIVTLPFGLYAMMIGRCVSTISSSLINAFPNRRLIGYSYGEQIRDMLPSLLLSAAMCAIVLAVGLLNLNVWLTMLIQIIVGGGVYCAGAKLFKFECMEYIIGTARGFVKKK